MPSFNVVAYAPMRPNLRGRPNEADTEENYKKVHRIALNDRKLSQITYTVKISTERVHNIWA